MYLIENLVNFGCLLHWMIKAESHMLLQYVIQEWKWDTILRKNASIPWQTGLSIYHQKYTYIGTEDIKQTCFCYSSSTHVCMHTCACGPTHTHTHTHIDKCAACVWVLYVLACVCVIVCVLVALFVRDSMLDLPDLLMRKKRRKWPWIWVSSAEVVGSLTSAQISLVTAHHQSPSMLSVFTLAWDCSCLLVAKHSSNMLVISWTDLIRQLYLLPRFDRSRRSNLPSQQVKVYWHWVNQS